MASNLRLDIEPLADPVRTEHGWAAATLYLQDEPYWFGGEPAGQAGRLEWTWIDLLAYLAQHWSALMLEETWPLELRDVPHPGKLLEKAESRWENMPEARIGAEESLLLQYLDRHNLAVAMNGAYLPMLLWVRSGNTLWLVNEEEQAQRVDFHSTRHDLEIIGNQLAGCFAHSTQRHIQQIVSQWQQRDRQLRSDFLHLRSGLSVERLELLQQSLSMALPANDCELVEQDPVYLAAARMSRYQLSTEQIGRVMQRLAQALATGKKPFAALEHMAERELAGLEQHPPFEQGYRLARWLRHHLGLSSAMRFEPEHLLKTEGVQIEEADLGSSQIDAIACWGSVDPLILLNSHPDARASNEHGRRSTLAHELCHLLVDRRRALPVAEVLGGEMDSESEKRANAFAAEVLLPQAQALAVLRTTAGRLDSVLQALQQSHGVSKMLAAYQLYNAPGSLLSEDERVALRNYF